VPFFVDVGAQQDLDAPALEDSQQQERQVLAPAADTAAVAGGLEETGERLAEEPAKLERTLPGSGSERCAGGRGVEVGEQRIDDRLRIAVEQEQRTQPVAVDARARQRIDEDGTYRLLRGGDAFAWHRAPKRVQRSRIGEPIGACRTHRR
jgi:hypothetical protein